MSFSSAMARRIRAAARLDPHRRKLLGAALGAGLVPGFVPGLVPSARAEWVPARPVRIIVPYGAGGGADLLARRVAERAKELLGQPVVVDNRPGGGTAIGAVAVQNSAPDGHTLLLATSTTLCVNPALQRQLSYAPEKFVPVANLQLLPFMVNVAKDSPVRSMKDLRAYAIERNNQLNYGTLGIGSSNHVLGGLLSQRAAPGLVPVHYTSGPQALVGLVRGDIHIYFDGISTSVPRVRQGELRGIAVTSRERVPAVPEIPTVYEEGFPEVGLSVWYGLVAPAGTPADAVTRLNAVFNQILQMPDIVDAMVGEGTRPIPLTPSAFADLIREDTVVWRRAIEDLKIKIE
ncbi:MAG: Bug family tripartite tricarboxylate transporter substrate binding protein [Lautropia sp.]